METRNFPCKKNAFLSKQKTPVLLEFFVANIQYS